MQPGGRGASSGETAWGSLWLNYRILRVGVSLPVPTVPQHTLPVFHTASA